MERFENKNTVVNSETNQESHILDYPTLVDTVKVSLARQIDIPGSLDAKTFHDVLLPFSYEQRNYIEHAVGERFDDELIYYLTCRMMIEENRSFTIMAEDEDGFNGYLPWQTKLEEAMNYLNNSGELSGAHVAVERYTHATDTQTISALGDAALTTIAA